MPPENNENVEAAYLYDVFLKTAFRVCAVLIHLPVISRYQQAKSVMIQLPVISCYQLAKSVLIQLSVVSCYQQAVSVLIQLPVISCNQQAKERPSSNIKPSLTTVGQNTVGMGADRL